MGVATTFYDPALNGDGITALMQPNTRVLYAESPGSHTFEVQDVPSLAKAAHARGVKLLLDNTWGVHFFQPFQHGVDVSIQALTKYVAGHSDFAARRRDDGVQGGRGARAQYGDGARPIRQPG